MKNKKIPSDIAAAIRKSAIDGWDDDADMVAYTIETETAAYLELDALDFGTAASFRESIIAAVSEISEGWNERLSMAKLEIEAFQELHAAKFDGVPAKEISRLKKEAEQSFPDDFTGQRDHVVAGARRFIYVRDLRARIEPIKNLLLDMEGIIGDECYNANIQNYRPGGIWEGEGRSFRYPVKFDKGDESLKRRYVAADIDPEVLMTGRYQFGSNELGIFRALVKVVEMLERDYGIRITDANRKK
ncbi:hypothetical protein [Rhizobium leguminosarum]